MCASKVETDTVSGVSSWSVQIWMVERLIIGILCLETTLINNIIVIHLWKFE